ncbi:MAG: carboxymuconolactone decarboxylase family protein [Candidatus Binatia bacterium]
MPVTIPLPTDAELTPELREILDSLPALNIFRMPANAPANLKPFVDYGLSLLFCTELDARKREIAILRVAHVTRSRYEWTQHATLARRVGVTDAEIAALAVDGPVVGLGEDGQLLCRVAEEISRDVRLSDEALRTILDRYGRRQAVELILCCSHFNMVSRRTCLEKWQMP